MLKEFLTASNKLHVPRYLLGRVLVFPSTVINLLKAVYSRYIYFLSFCLRFSKGSDLIKIFYALLIPT